MDPHIPPYAPASPGALASSAVEPLLTREFDADPAPVYERLREKYGPVAPVLLLGVPVWLVLGYDEVLSVLRNQRGLWSKRVADWRDHAQGRVPADWPLLPVYQSTGTPFQEGAAHAELREAWAAGLQPFQSRARPQARRLEDEIRGHADELLDLLAEGGPDGFADLSAQYARPLAVMACNRLIGFDATTDEAVVDIWRVVDAGPGADAALARLTGGIGRVVAARHRPGDDLPSGMLAARPELTAEQIATEMVNVISTLGDMGSSLICNTIVEVVAGDAGARVGLATGMVGETVNRAAMAKPPNTNMTFRFARADTALGGVAIAAGDPVMASVAAAHADPRFADALDPHSVNSSRAHLAWGAGPHRCPADELATRIVTIAVERLFERMAELELGLPVDQLPWRSSPLMRGLRSLPVRYRLHERPTAAAQAAPPQATESGEPDEDARGGRQSPIARLVRALLRQGS
ncbi:cytochrome P450 [Actinomadura fibrosa]|uniref:Cytochrome P450 n=1 Tax=Actinomadura fibrosa TaxID=111802 RepID=A0ABW2XXS2_9ACTN|nr:cytochrome P450 [Actinomadura fibrosa]